MNECACREHVAQLCQYQDEFKRLNTEVLIIAFGTLPSQIVRPTGGRLLWLTDVAVVAHLRGERMIRG